MPKQKITREMIVDTAFELARREGMESVQVKAIAEALHCSVQPIYSYCQNVEGLRQAVMDRADAFLRERIAGQIDPRDPFKSTGMAYLRAAQQEPKLYALFLLRRRQAVDSLDALIQTQTAPGMAQVIARQLDISLEQARALHLHMLIYTVGMGAILATTGVPAEEAMRQLETAYDAFFESKFTSIQSQKEEKNE